MNIIPAIDLINGQCVRLQKGDFNAITQYTVTPEDMAMNYQQSGASYLHVVDLDGAKQGKLKQLDVINRIRNSTTSIMQVGGGIKDEETIDNLLSIGVDRVVLGSIAVKDYDQTVRFIERFGADKIVLALDVNIVNGTPMVATHGWVNTSDQSLYNVIDYYLVYGLEHVLCTDISKDGMLQGANTQLYQDLVAKYPNISFQASGGIGALADLHNLKKTKVQNVIVGRALYENKFSLNEALAC
ncbi:MULTISPECIES: 1-(5-phosphoribosyl)-5-[(5-phosphoribosylamino)methylideneamino]imidazole-4-carboxamide isomerase [Cysteiniphilum]|uniref:1-(5-phosphoribosyl)-5-[(5-phosphoribosylamino)methylideneamino] imidazole-4-carboxamide isomerase n=1 Tax=Cysteiniphilum litorale TaxID=2056700 RepID=A0A8J3E8N9_9GAMM|nr:MULTISPECIES: 1-(5-phosphoribosyl)-5-[(5-phosphoribosylamino)methylideneamino]imidazole-4-carboxamide isomerase [Cysteiniphilum]GGF94904.1 1-(5-phosphoribosyl)-5-[(5-phosphoribosylamino) methylideneamino] imidazole-4-carboxamide isomerase [Cysteiniphilum litorale]